jgi:hypothetical protein
MSSNPQRKLPFPATRPAYRTLQGWALGTLIEQSAVMECGPIRRLEPGQGGSVAEPITRRHGGSVHSGDG